MVLLKTANTVKVLFSESFHVYSILQKYKQTRCIKNSNLRKKVGIAIKSKETSSQFKSVRNIYVATRCIKNSNLRKEVATDRNKK